MASGRQGLMVSLEAVDGAGKSSQVEAMARLLRAEGWEVVVTREPGGTPLAESLRQAALSMPMDGLTETLLMFAARRDHIKQVIEPALKRGAVVICDRFTDSTFAYQGGGRGFSWETLEQLEFWVQDGLQPDVTFWFDVSAKEAARRRGSARSADRFEAEDEAFFLRVIEGYERRAKQSPNRFVRLDASKDMGGVWADLERELRAVLAGR
jgi:dTMP kinase